MQRSEQHHMVRNRGQKWTNDKSYLPSLTNKNILFFFVTSTCSCMKYCVINVILVFDKSNKTRKLEYLNVEVSEYVVDLFLHLLVHDDCAVVVLRAKQILCNAE